jgi:prepilin-type N-terminal cleavage/methylation domain-containing protein
MNKKGFTLIELLVVIAIIGILSAVAIIYLADARAKANDAKVKANITTMSTEFELANLGTLSTTEKEAALAKIAADPKFGTYPCTFTGSGYRTSTSATSTAFFGLLCSDQTKFFCADSTGYRGELTSAPTVTGKCN